MSLFTVRPRSEARSIESLPWVAGGTMPHGADLESALALVPVYAAVRLIADGIGSLPLQQFRKSGDSRTPMPLARMFEPSDGSRMDWIVRPVVSALVRGNAFGLKHGLDSATAGPESITWLDPTRVEWSKGEGWYFESRPVPSEKMLHIPGLVLPGSRLGVTPLTMCRAAIEAGLSTQDFMSGWYKNKAVPGAVFKNTERDLDPTAAAAAKERVRATMRAGEPFVIGKDWSLDILTLSADDAGFVKAAQLTASQVATIFGIPPEMIGGESAGSLTYSTVELNQIQFLTNTLRPWITRFEQAFSALLPKPQYVKFNIDAMIRVETKTRWEVARIAREIGAKNADEIRALEELPPIPGGLGQDYAPLKMTPASTQGAKP